MPTERSLAPFALAAVVLSAACLQGATAPKVAPRGTLAPGEGDLGKSPDQAPFAVVFGSPKGQTRDPSEITIVWNRPMRPLDLAGQEAPVPAQISPAAKGRWQWVGTNAAIFVPERRLPRATFFTVEVPQGTRAETGETLAAPYRLTFSTALPDVVRVEPSNRSEDLKPDTTFTIRLNQPVDDAAIRKSIALSFGEKAENVAFEIRRPDAANEQRVDLVPKAPLPLDSDIYLRVASDLQGREGKLTSLKERSFQFRTYGPLVVRGTRCDNDTPHGACSVEGGVALELSNRVRVGDLKKALRVDPAVKIRFPEWYEDDDQTSQLAVYGRFSPGKKYRIRVAAQGLKDEHGQALAREFVSEVAFDDYWPTAEIGMRGSIFEPSVKREIPIGSLNVRSLDLAVAPMTEESVLALDAPNASYGSIPSLEAIGAMPGSKRAVLRPSAAPNAPWVHDVSTEETLGGPTKRGPIAIGISYTDRPGTKNASTQNHYAIAQVTDLGITAKVSQRGTLVWVTHLSNTQPVAGATVAIRRSTDKGPPQTFSTDASGFAAIPPSAFQPAKNEEEHGVIFVRSGEDWAYRRVGSTLSPWRFGAPYEYSGEGPFGMVFTERGIYRPGDTVRLKGIFREEGDGPAIAGAPQKGAVSSTKTPAGRVVNIQVDGPDGSSVAKASQALNEFGTVAVDVVIPATGRLGTYSVQASVEGSPRGYADVTHDFEVAEYKPAAFKVGVESDKPSYVRGDSASCVARGDYLFGAPMTSADARLSMRREATWFSPPDLEDFVTNESAYFSDLPDRSPREAEVQASESKLDSKGTARIGATLVMPGQRGPELLTCGADITDVARQSIASSSTALVHPAEFYVAMKTGPDVFVKAGDTLKPQILAVDPKGARVAGVSVRAELVQRTWTLARQNMGAGSFHTVSTPVDKVAASCDVTTGTSPASCSLTISGSGYFIVRATAKDKRQNPIGAAAGIYAMGEGVAGWNDSDKQVVELVPDRKSYEVGQTARVLVKSPFTTAEALVTVERAGISTQRRVTLGGATPTIDVPITDDLRPNAFVSVLLVKGRTKAPPKETAGKPAAADVGAPTFRMGYASLPINPESRRLAIKLRSNKADYLPGETVHVDVDVKDRAGSPARAEVTLYAVDEGVLSLIGYETPDPIPVFGAPRPLRVMTIESREALARVQRPFADLGLDKGLAGGGGAESAGVRRDFRSSAYYHPTLVTDEKGHVEASFKLPDSLTTFRIMAVSAATDDRFGFAEERVTASRPLMARPAFPRIIRAGDALDAGVVVTSKGLAKAQVDVEIRAEGLKVSGAVKRSIELPAGESVEVRFPLSAERAGKAKVRFDVKGGGASDAVEITRDVAPPTSLEAVSLYGDTTQASAEKLGDLSALRDDVGGLTVSLSSTALVGLGGGVEQLIEYPYGCTEQLVSRLVPLLPLRDLARDFSIPLPQNLDGVVTSTVAKIVAAQRPDGGFGLWPDSERASSWVTAYALWGLSEAKRRGVIVPTSAIEGAIRSVRRDLSGIKDDLINLASATLIVDVLAETGSPDPGRATWLFERREKLPLFAQALLAHALVVGKGDPSMVDKLVSEMEGRLRVDGPAARAVENTGDAYATLMDSSARTSALVLRALVAARPSHALAPRLAMGLLADRRGGTWRSTQETAWALLALDAYRRVQEKVEPNFTARVFLGEAEITSASFEGRSVKQAVTTLPAAGLVAAGGSALAFDVDGKGRLFYEARLRYARKQMPTQPLDRGFFVKKTLRAVTPRELSEALKIVPEKGASAFEGGGLVLADVVVVTPSPREFVVVDDPLPAGLEAVDARLATTAGDLAGALEDDDYDRSSEEGFDDDDVAAGRAYNPSWFIREVRDDRVLFFVDHMAAGMYRYRYLARATTLGSFVLPPTRAEEMYTPEVFGRSAAGSVTVTPKAEGATNKAP